MLNLIWYQSLDEQGTSPPQISSWIIFLSNLLHSYFAPEAEGLPLNTPSEGFVDQDCLINYDGCDENLECASSRPYFVCSALLTAFATRSPFFSLHSLQQLSPPYCIQNGSFNRASLPLQLSLVEGRHINYCT